MSGDGCAPYERTDSAVVGSMPAADARVQHVDGSYRRLRQIDVVSLYETSQFQVVALDFLLLDRRSSNQCSAPLAHRES
eukprot:3577030-Rhodomonas_salina.1